MKVFIGADKKGLILKNEIVAFLKDECGFDVVDVSADGDKDFYDASIKVVKRVLQDTTNNKGIIIDEYGEGSFMVADKFKYIICAELNDEHSAKMTRDHNNSNIITMGSAIVGECHCRFGSSQTNCPTILYG